jgi:hypothetical protein
MTKEEAPDFVWCNLFLSCKNYFRRSCKVNTKFLPTLNPTLITPINYPDYVNYPLDFGMFATGKFLIL